MASMTSMACVSSTLSFGAQVSTAVVGANRSEISGLTSAFQKLTATAPTRVVPNFIVCPEAKRVCDLTGKKRNNGYKVSFSKTRVKHLQQANLQHKRIWWPQGKRFVRLKLSTKALKTLEWKSLEAMAKEAGIDLADY